MVPEESWKFQLNQGFWNEAVILDYSSGPYYNLECPYKKEAQEGLTTDKENAMRVAEAERNW